MVFIIFLSPPLLTRKRRRMLQGSIVHPQVPVMMEAPDSSGQSWQAGGWLGVITAGSLW
eukprot:COSAG04_NODE_1165_length_7994_cov_50.104370_4_plen_59_part_00